MNTRFSTLEADGERLAPQVKLAQEVRAAKRLTQEVKLATARMALDGALAKFRTPLEAVHVAAGLFEVTSEKGADTYHVSLRKGRESCDCPHFMHRLSATGGRCKHLSAAVQANRARALKAARNRTPEELSELLESGAHYRPEMEEAIRQALSEWRDAEPARDPTWAVRVQEWKVGSAPVRTCHPH